MNIIYQTHPSLPATIFKIDDISIVDDALHVILNCRYAAEVPMPGGKPGIPQWSQQQIVPLEVTTNPEGTTTGIAGWLISASGPFVGGTIATDEELPMIAKRIELLTAVKAKRDEVQESGVMTPFGRVQTDFRSMMMVNGAVSMAAVLGSGFTVDWRMANDALVSLDATQMTQMGLLVGQHMAAAQSHKNVLDAAINAAETLEELGEINIDTGWPS